MTFDTRTHTQSRGFHARLHLPITTGVIAGVLAVTVLVGPTSGVSAFGTPGRAAAAAPEPAAAPPFPGVAGVDLAALGYRGVDLDAVTVASLDGALPELPMDRAAELRSRIVVGTAHLEGLRRAEYLLYEAARTLDPKIAWSRRAQLEAWEVHEEAETRLARGQARVAQLAALRAERPALDLSGPRDDLAVDEQRAIEARAESVEADQRLATQLAKRRAHRAALDLTTRDANRMDRHLRYLGNELRSARAAMLPAGRWLADVWRGRADMPLVRVEGFRVHHSIAPALRDMVAAARADGVDLRGDGYRPVKRQIELRKQNCGPTPYDVYERPGGTCSPPTAPPGRSLHEVGLAVDFRHGPEGISSRRSPAYQWLAANAPQYGFYNLPGEPWHWSVSGR